MSENVTRLTLVPEVFFCCKERREEREERREERGEEREDEREERERSSERKHLVAGDANFTIMLQLVSQDQFSYKQPLTTHLSVNNHQSECIIR